MGVARRGGWLAALALAAITVHADDAEPPSDKERREQINAERAATQARYEKAVAECERGFMVTSCVNQAKAERRTALDRLSREQMALDDAQRKRRADERRERIAQKKAAQAAASEAAASPPQAQRTPRQSAVPASGAKAARRAEPRSSEAEAAAAAEAAERASDAQQRREKAQAHEEAVRKRNAERAAQRTPAAPLPVPDAQAASAPTSGGRGAPSSAPPASPVR